MDVLSVNSTNYNDDGNTTSHPIECTDIGDNYELAYLQFQQPPLLDVNAPHASPPYVPDEPTTRLDNPQPADVFDMVVDLEYYEQNYVYEVEWRKRGSLHTRPDSGYGSSLSNTEGIVTIELRKWEDSEVSVMGKVPVGKTYTDIWLSLHQQAFHIMGHSDFVIYRDDQLVSTLLTQSIQHSHCLVVRPKP